MSCFIMNPDSIRRIGYTLASILDASSVGNEYSIAAVAAQIADLPKVFQQYYSPVRGYNAEGISEDLHIINVCAYASRYRESPFEPFPDPVSKGRYSMTQRPAYEDHTERPQEWHYHLMHLLDCWLYQTAEDATFKNEKRIALQAFSNALAVQMVQHSEAYNRFRWGE